MTAEEKRREKARNMRYKKPIVTGLNLDTIRSELWEIREKCENIAYYCEDNDLLIDALGGDEEEAYEFRMMFSDLDAECDQMQADLNDWWYSEKVEMLFDLFFVAAGAGSSFGGILGFDVYEQDYYGLEPFLEQKAEKESIRKIERMTKKEIMDVARRCFRIYQSYIALRYRYDCLEASLEILEEKNNGYIQMIKQFEELYDRADRLTEGFKYNYDDDTNLDRVLDAMPQEVWLW